MGAMQSTQLLKASEAGDIAKVQRLVEQGADKEAKDNDGNTALLRATHFSGHLDVVQHLVEQGANKEAKNSGGYTALLRATSVGRLDMVQYLVDQGANKEAKNNNGCTVLLRAVERGHLDVVQYLVKQGATVDAKDKDGFNALLRAAWNGRLDLVQYLIEQGAKIEARDNHGYTALLKATFRFHLDIVRYLVKQGADIEARDNYGYNALLRAAWNGRLDNVRCLVEQGANIEAKESSRYTALLIAARYGRLDIVRYLVEQRADIDAKNKGGYTALARAFLENHLEVVSYLVEQGAGNINAKDKNGRTALMKAIQLRDISLVNFFLQNRADPSLIDNDGSSALIHLLLQFKAGEEHRIRRIVKLMLERGVPPLKSNNDGKSAKSIARTKGFHYVVALIEEYAAQPRPNQDDPEPKTPRWYISPDKVHRERSALVDGGFGAVHRAKWSNIDVIVKAITEADMKRFLKEVKLWSGLRHDNVVPFYGANHREPPFFVVSKFAAEGTLCEYLSKENRRQTVVWRKLCEVAIGLNYLHQQGVIHGDLKGNNIVVDKDDIAMLTDFGLSFLDSGESSIMETKSGLGAMQWRAPEYATDTMTQPSQESDVYSLGMCIIEAVTGWRSPWGAGLDQELIRKKIRQGNVEIEQPDAMTTAQWGLVSRMIAFKRNDRPDMDEVVSTLKDFAFDEEYEAREEARNEIDMSEHHGLAAKSIARAKGFHHVVDLIEEYAVKPKPDQSKPEKQGTNDEAGISEHPLTTPNGQLDMVRHHDTIVRPPIEHGAQVNTNYKTKLMKAAENGHDTVVRQMIKVGADVNAAYTLQLTPLMLAAKNGHDTVARLLIKHGAFVNASDIRQLTPLMRAAENGHEIIVQRLIEHGAQVNAVDENQLTPLMKAAENGHDAVVRMLIEHGADVNAEEEGHVTPLILAAKNGHDTVARRLINRGANVNPVDEDQWTPLIWAAQNGHKIDIERWIDYGADINANDRNHWTPLICAAMNGHIDIARVLVGKEANVNLPDKNLWTPLMWATQYGHKDVVQLLIHAGASVDSAANGKQTALMLAAQNGHNTIAQELISHGASTDTTNDKLQTALMFAASDGHPEVVRTLLDKKASAEAMDKNDETALMYAIDNSHESVVREFLSEETCLSHGMTLLKLGLQKRREHAAAKKKAIELAKAEVKLEDLVQLCSKMNEAQRISERICSRLEVMQNQLKTLNQLATQEATPRFKQLVHQTHGFMAKYEDKHTVTRLVGSQVVIDASHDLNRQLDAFVLQFDISIDPKGVHDWKGQWEEDAVTMKSHLRASLAKKDVIAKELQDQQVQKEALTLLMFACDSKRGSRYSEDEMALIHSLFQYISSMSQLQIADVPEWFVPPHMVNFNTSDWFAKGSFGSIHRGTWNGTEVVIKSAFQDDDNSREMFLKETEIWYKLKHPHIVSLIRACHVGNPFFVCDYASNGTLSDYLSKDENRFQVWAKLREAALGLQYLHKQHKVVHGDLKCNNILVGADNKAKLTDFGLSFVLKNEQEETPAPSELGAINWKAPEVISGKTRGTFASDVYSFGMCIVEAATGRVPFGAFPHLTVKYVTVTKKALPQQPSEMSDTQWDLVKRMCSWEPADRISISEAVDILDELDIAEQQKKWDELCAKHE